MALTFAFILGINVGVAVAPGKRPIPPDLLVRQFPEWKGHPCA